MLVFGLQPPGPNIILIFFTVNGGITASVVDTAAGCAVQYMLPVGGNMVSTNIKANYLGPVTLDPGPLTCEGKVIHMGQRPAIAKTKMTEKLEGSMALASPPACSSAWLR